MCCNLFTVTFKKLKNMKKENYLPFDLETALKHPERVITRDGRKVSQLTKFEAKDDGNDIVYAVLDGKVYNWTIDGYFFTKETPNYDLLLIPKIKQCWINLYEMISGELHVVKFFSKESAEASQFHTHSIKYIKTIRITNEPE